ncbi:hypothetical protein GH714_032434 [Hevea brasiliensis]|uniref:Clp R domain-containing protein n=1 Tax=Hevea brasiliensis TaxID=3981 RepID=A0A6A6NBY8_HEVBR|nr:hypothetical protein GH714_032434 [Hevea brasiliensis]
MEKLEKKTLKTKVLSKYGSDLTKMAEEGKLDLLIGREKQVERVMQILCKRRKNNPCLIGDPGVGKTVVVEGLASKIVKATVPLKLQGKKVFALDMGRLISGASNRGDFEERLMEVVDEVKEADGAIILFIDELHTIVGVGAGGQALDAANILKPALARGELKCIGATTLQEYRKYIEKDGALKRRFQAVDVPEPSVEEAIEILRGLCQKYEEHHSVKYKDEALVAAVSLSKQYMSDVFLPDKAIDLIDEAGARFQLQQVKHSSPRKKWVVTKRNIEQVVSMWTGIPVEKVTIQEAHRLLNMEQKLHEHIIGQHEAVQAVSRAIKRARVGVRDPINELLASYLLVLQGLFGSPPGYVGYDEGGQLTEAVRRRPHSVILFDEIEKAHSDVFNTLLQVLDDGIMTDGKGHKVDFKNTIIILTSNKGGSSVALQRLLGFEQVKQLVAEELKQNFRPEFLNRIDEVVVFQQLTKSQLKEIVEIMLKEVYKRLIKAKNVKLQVTDRLKEKVIEEGENPSYGARPLKRAIVRIVEDNLADGMLNGAIKEGDLVFMDIDDLGKVIMF